MAVSERDCYEIGVPVRLVLSWVFQIITDEEPLGALSLTVSHHASIEVVHCGQTKAAEACHQNGKCVLLKGMALSIRETGLWIYLATTF